VAGPIDLYAATPVASDDVDLGTYDLQAGIQLLKLEIVGKNPAAAPNHGVALESVRFRKEP
jgi:hypothetical protein